MGCHCLLPWIVLLLLLLLLLSHFSRVRRFVKSDITATDIIADLSAKKSLKDISIEEAGIDDIIKIAYGS